MPAPIGDLSSTLRKPCLRREQELKPAHSSSKYRGLVGPNPYHLVCLVRARSDTLSPPIETLFGEVPGEGIPWMHDHRLIFNRSVANDS